MPRAEDVRSWMALAGRRIDVLHVLVTEGGAAGLTPSDVAQATGADTNTAQVLLRGLEMVREAECRNGRWFATTRGQAVVVSFDEWMESEEIPY